MPGTPVGRGLSSAVASLKSDHYFMVLDKEQTPLACLLRRECLERSGCGVRLNASEPLGIVSSLPSYTNVRRKPCLDKALEVACQCCGVSLCSPSA